MNFSDLISSLPEVILSVMLLLMVLISAFLPSRLEGRVSFGFSLLTLFAVLSGIYVSAAFDGRSFDFLGLPGLLNRTMAFSKLFVVDYLSIVLKGLTVIVFVLTFIYSRPYLKVKALYQSNFFLIALFALLGQFIMISAANMLTLYLGIELLALSMYTLVALPRDQKIATEAAMKYFVLGALASGFLLYGISLLYGATGALNLTDVLEKVKDITVLGAHTKKTVLLLGVVFVVAGLAFKLGAVPFHAWVPDVYQGSTTPVTLLLAAAPKFAAFALLIRFLVEGLFGLVVDWQKMLVVLAVLSLLVGNLTAIVQTNLKRLLAYSTIAHIGFVLLGFVGGVIGVNNAAEVEKAYTSSMFYVMTYVLTTLGTFGVILLLSLGKTELHTLDDLKGLSKRSPWIAFLMLILMFSLAGLPPVVGFYAKLVVLKSLADAKMYWLAIFAVVTSLVGAFYYLRVVKFMYFDAPVSQEPLPKSLVSSVFLTLNVILVFVLGLIPSGLYQVCFDAIKHLNIHG